MRLNTRLWVRNVNILFSAHHWVHTYSCTHTHTLLARRLSSLLLAGFQEAVDVPAEAAAMWTAYFPTVGPNGRRRRAEDNATHQYLESNMARLSMLLDRQFEGAFIHLPNVHGCALLSVVLTFTRCFAFPPFSYSLLRNLVCLIFPPFRLLLIADWSSLRPYHRIPVPVLSHLRTPSPRPGFLPTASRDVRVALVSSPTQFCGRGLTSIIEGLNEHPHVRWDAEDPDLVFLVDRASHAKEVWPVRVRVFDCVCVCISLLSYTDRVWVTFIVLSRNPVPVVPRHRKCRRLFL